MSKIVDLIILVGGVLLALYVVLDDTLPGWLIRLAYAAAIVAGTALLLQAARRLSGRP